MNDSPLIDAHLHLQDSRFDDPGGVLQRARKAGLGWLFCNGTREDDWSAVRSLSEQSPLVVPFLGIHPWYCHRVSSRWLTHLRHLITIVSCGIGEIGLDRGCGIEYSLQEKFFLEQLNLGVEFHRPVVIHCIRYWGKCLELLERVLPGSGGIPVMIHSFSGSMETMKRLVRLGCTLSFSARLMGRDQEALRAVFQAVDTGHLLLETDSPDQLTSIHRQTHTLNEPALIGSLYRFGARLKQMPLDDFSNQILANGTVFAHQTTAG